MVRCTSATIRGQKIPGQSKVISRLISKLAHLPLLISALFLPISKYQDILTQKELDMAGAPHIPKGTTDNARQLSGKEVFVGAAVIMIGVLIFVWAISEFAI